MSLSKLEKKFIDYTRRYRHKCENCGVTFFTEEQFNRLCDSCADIPQKKDDAYLGKINLKSGLTHSDLVNLAEKWLLKRCGFVFKELSTFGGEIPDAIGFRSGETILIECKTSRNDFLSDKYKIFRKRPKMGMGSFRFYLCPRGLIKKEELPEKWGLINVNEKGVARKAFGPKFTSSKDHLWRFIERNTQAEMAMMYSALRRLHLRGQIPLIYEKLKRNDA